MPAVGQYSLPSTSLIIRPAATVIDRGAAAVPSAYVVCQPGDYVSLNISLTERSGHAIASGSGSQDFNCTGQIETVTVPVAATDKPFVAGKAFAQASFFDCGPTICSQTNATRSVTLQVKKKK